MKSEAGFEPLDYRASQRYQTDQAFRALVDSLEHQLHRAQYTPSELREAVLLAMSHFEIHRLRQYKIRDDRVVDQLREIHREIDRLRAEAMVEFGTPL